MRSLSPLKTTHNVKIKNSLLTIEADQRITTLRKEKELYVPDDKSGSKSPNPKKRDSGSPV